MKHKGWLIAGGVVLVLVGLAFAAPFLVPASSYRAPLEKSAFEAMGREVKINGGLRFSIFPTLGLSAKQVTVANLPGGKAPLFANVDELDVGVKLLPLFQGDIEVSKLILKKPKIALEADVGGKPNWVFEPAQKPAAQPQSKGMDIDKLSLGDLRIEDGELTYRDKFGKVQAVSAFNAAIAMKSLNEPFSLKSDFTYAGDPVKLSLDAPKPRALLDKQATPISVLLESEKLTAKLDGALDPATFAVTGKLDAKGPSIRKLAAWVGSPIGDGGGLQSFAVIGDISQAGPTTTLTNAKVAIDDAHGGGNITITTPDGAPPYVKGNLTLAALDVNPYLAAPQTPGAANAAGAGGVDVKAGWGKDKIDLSGLKAINADLAITTGALTFQKMKLDKADLFLNLKDGVMRATLKQISLYGGAGSGLLVIDARGPAIKLQNSLSVTGLSAKPFLTDAMGLDKIEGTTKIDMAIGAAGDTQQALMESLVGKADFTFTDGALVGVNLAQIARQVQSALTGAAVGPAAKTDFAEMAATFKLANGVAHTDDLHMLNPFVRITGAGDINLGRQTMDMKITPKAVSTIQGQGGKQEAGGIGIPFHVKGDWAKLKFTPDLGGVVQEQIDKVLGNTKLPDLGTLFGQKPKPKTP
ncbi:MAG TPA: AsmA family protein [Caulobacterales bacterium]|nr:AsmA family protein [Caulobacterales bacterium]